MFGSMGARSGGENRETGKWGWDRTKWETRGKDLGATETQ